MRKDKYFNIFYLSRSRGVILYGKNIVGFEYKDNDTMDILFILEEGLNIISNCLKPFSEKLGDREKVQFGKAWHNYLKKLDEGYTCNNYIIDEYLHGIYPVARIFSIHDFF